jgi:hypothetical protein
MEKFWRHAATWVALSVAGLGLMACGGGGDSAPDLCGGSDLRIAPVYEVGGKTYSGTQTIFLIKGAALDARLVLQGLPGACQGRTTIAAKVVGDLPAGLTLEAATGRITGTPTMGSSLRIDVSIAVQNYSSSVRESFTFALF